MRWATNAGVRTPRARALALLALGRVGRAARPRRTLLALGRSDAAQRDVRRPRPQPVQLALQLTAFPQQNRL
jgi:hypothetical protein